MIIESDVFRDGAKIPPRYTCDGDDVSPPLGLAGGTGRGGHARAGHG
jgi:phosphatidylethanolamine-binding protein (PEBP) family uncharacterized protein